MMVGVEAVKTRHTAAERVVEAKVGGSTLTETQRVPLPRGRRRSRTLGRYRLLELLGRGGMGEVYCAYDPGLDRRVAVKRLRHGGPLGDRARTRLLREAQVAARVCHTNVAQIFDVGIDRISEDAFIAMELVEGDTLRSWRKHPRTWREIVAVFSAVGRGLMAAHSQGVVHRDFKPENVLLGEDGEAKIVDFGLAKPAPDARASKPSGETVLALASHSGLWRATEEITAVVEDGNVLTPEGARLGTPAYMPPEQIHGQPSDPRSDQYSFAVSLYEALNGELPFVGSDARKYAVAVLDGQVQPFPRGSKVPRRLRRAVMRALSYRPRDRFRTMQPLLAELERALRPSRVRSPLLAVGVLLGLGLGLGIWAWHDGDATVARGPAAVSSRR